MADWDCDRSSGHATNQQNLNDIGACLVLLSIVSGCTILWKIRNFQPVVIAGH